ncbi:MAG: LysR substrate-binding domain-containing protein [Pseudomonadota bacterium]
MRNLPLTALRALAAVYETGGIRPAGRLLGVQHSAVSRSLRDLEAWLEIDLFEKETGHRTLRFTAQGTALGQAALVALNDLDAAILKTREGLGTNSVTVATTPSVAARWLLPRLPLLSEAHPRIEVSILVDQALKTPRATGADINIRMGSRPPDHLDPRPMMDEALFPVVAPKYWTDLGQPSQIEELTGLTLLHDRDPNASWSMWRSKFGPRRLDIRRGPRMTSSDLVLRAAEQGQGVALARGQLSKDSLANGTLMRLFGSTQIEIGTNYWLIANPETKHRRAVQAVTQWLLTEGETINEA